MASVLGLIELVQGAPSAVKWLNDAGVTQSHTLGVILAAAATIVFGLVALGPERVKRWWAIGRGQAPAPSPQSPPSTPPTTPAWSPPAKPAGREMLVAAARQPSQPQPVADQRRAAATKALAAAGRQDEQRERIKREVITDLTTEQPESISPELRKWLDHERERGDEFTGSIKKQKRRLAGESSFIFDSLSMFGPDPPVMLRRLTGEAATWSVKVQRRLAAELPSRADAFDGKPPPAHPDPTQGDFNRLADYIEQRGEALKAILGD